MDLLKHLILQSKYAQYKNENLERETAKDILGRVQTLYIKKAIENIDKYDTDIINEIIESLDFDWGLPSMRALQFAGKAIEKDNQRIYNCTYTPLKDFEDFSDAFYLMLCGCGVGYSVRAESVLELPVIVDKSDAEKIVYTIHDSIAGWASALLFLLKSYSSSYPYSKSYTYSERPIFDYSEIRPKGSLIKTVGGIAPGHEVLKKALEMVEEILINAAGRRLTSVEVSDIICIMADCVASGGSRRAALIALFDFYDYGMRKYKTGDWFEKHIYRSRANISAVVTSDFLRNNKKAYDEFMNGAVDAGFGEPGLVVIDAGKEYGVNPCVEILLLMYCLCNLVEISGKEIDSLESFKQAIKKATIVGTIQALFTNFSYIKKDWQKNAENESLLGVSITGIMDSEYLYNLYKQNNYEEIREVVKYAYGINRKYAKILGINPAKRITCIKPAGSTSCLLGCSSGIHAPYAEYYIRRIRIISYSSIANLFRDFAPHLIEESIDSKMTSVISIPIHHPTPNNIYTKDMNIKDQIDIASWFYKHWCCGVDNLEDSGLEYNHNVSITVQYAENEKEDLKEIIYDALSNKKLSAVSFFPRSEVLYPQSPFEVISKKEYEKIMKTISNENLIELLNDLQDDEFLETNFGSACEGGKCEI